MCFFICLDLKNGSFAYALAWLHQNAMWPKKWRKWGSKIQNPLKNSQFWTLLEPENDAWDEL
jgi:hypothetical protein